MHIHFAAIGGAGIGPLAQIAHKAGYRVSGSDQQNSSYIDYLKKQGIANIQIGDSHSIVDKINEDQPIDWVVYSSALTVVDKHPALLEWCQTNSVKCTKRDEFINQFNAKHNLKMIAVAGTHGKTTTTAMMVWLFKYFNQPLSYLLPAKTSFTEMGDYASPSQYFVYEADEFDRNFLAFKPAYSLITGVSWDHHEIYPTREQYKQAFVDFIDQSQRTFIWQKDAQYLNVDNPKISVFDDQAPQIAGIHLVGLYNRYDAWLATKAFAEVSEHSLSQVLEAINKFPGLSRRMEEISPNLYSDYAHTPEKIRAAVNVASEIAQAKNQSVIVVYEPLTNRRQLHILKDYKDCFSGVKKLYWLPSYLAREDPKDRIVEPKELIANLDDPTIGVPAKRDDQLKQIINHHLAGGDLVVGIAGGGGDSLDDWLRDQFSN